MTTTRRGRPPGPQKSAVTIRLTAEARAVLDSLPGGPSAAVERLLLAPAQTQDAGWFCIMCDTLCRTYDQGLACACGHPWETERYREEDYPPYWVRCRFNITIDKKGP